MSSLIMGIAGFLTAMLCVAVIVIVLISLAEPAEDEWEREYIRRQR